MNPVPPTRLCDDPEAPRLVRADLARAAKLPAVAFDAARGLAALEAALQAGGPAAPAAASGAALKPLAAALAKGALLGLVTVGVASVSSAWLDSRGASAPPRATSAMPAVAAPPAPAEPLDAPSAAVPAPRPAPGDSMARRPSLRPVDPGPPAPEPPAAPEVPPPAPSGESDLQMEMENLARLRALEPSDPQQALALAEEGRRRFPSGLYAQEREAHAIFALVRLGRRGEAEARARAFVAAYPHSPLVERIRERTGVGDKE
jgi:hypothetical protein